MPTNTTTRGNAGRWGAVRYADVTHPAVQSLPPLAFRVWVLLHTYTASVRDGAPHYGAWQIGIRRLADDLGIGGEDKDRRKTVRRALQAVVEAGLLSIEARTSNNADAWHSYSLRRPPLAGAVDEGGGTDAARGGGTGAARGGGTDAAGGGGTGAAPHTPTNTPRKHNPPNPPKGGDRIRPRVNRAVDDALRWLDDEMRALQNDGERLARIVEPNDPIVADRIRAASEAGRLLECVTAHAADIRDATTMHPDDAIEYADTLARVRVERLRDQRRALAASVTDGTVTMDRARAVYST